jgi:hypothetical protein
MEIGNEPIANDRLEANLVASGAPPEPAPLLKVEE